MVKGILRVAALMLKFDFESSAEIAQFGASLGTGIVCTPDEIVDNSN